MFRKLSLGAKVLAFFVSLFSWLFVPLVFPTRGRQAWNAATQFVSGRGLWSKDPVKLPYWFDPGVHVEELSSDRFRINAWGEAKNGYGDIVREKWTCIAEYEVNGEWAIKDYATSDPL